MRPIRTLLAAGIASLAMLTMAEGTRAAPPAYLMLRRAESPSTHYAPGYPDAALYDVRSSGYAYGWFGAAPRAHASRHFGYYRTYTNWNTR
jgi:hypothetical protein